MHLSSSVGIVESEAEFPRATKKSDNTFDSIFCVKMCESKVHDFERNMSTLINARGKENKMFVAI